MTYTDSFYTNRKSAALTSARRVAPWLFERMRVSSIADVGCGTGSWLATFTELGVTDVHGFDGPWLPVERLEIPRGKFSTIDFTRLEDFTVQRRFDLVISLEVAELLTAD